MFAVRSISVWLLGDCCFFVAWCRCHCRHRSYYFCFYYYYALSSSFSLLLLILSLVFVVAQLLSLLLVSTVVGVILLLLLCCCYYYYYSLLVHVLVCWIGCHCFIIIIHMSFYIIIIIIIIVVVVVGSISYTAAIAFRVKIGGCKRLPPYPLPWSMLDSIYICLGNWKIHVANLDSGNGGLVQVVLNRCGTD